MTDEKKITNGLDKDLKQLIDAELNDPVLGKLLNRYAAYVLGKEIKLALMNEVTDWLIEHSAEYLTFDKDDADMAYYDDVRMIKQFQKDFEL